MLSACASSRSLNFLLKDSFCPMIVQIWFTNRAFLLASCVPIFEQMFRIWILCLAQKIFRSALSWVKIVQTLKKTNHSDSSTFIRASFLKTMSKYPLGTVDWIPSYTPSHRVTLTTRNNATQLASRDHKIKPMMIQRMPTYYIQIYPEAKRTVNEDSTERFSVWTLAADDIEQHWGRR